ncbi:MAG TPA: acyl-CoA dehydrogenase family protein, partial [Acidobacteriota bacterium]|nr:acyl-CoA dehydrogenase family protein [Acidobacteriota bacterium]
MITPLSNEFVRLQEQVDDIFHQDQWTEESGDLAFCRNLVKQLGNAGVLNFLREAPSVRELCFLRYAIAQKTALGDLLFAMQGLGSYPIVLAGTAHQKAHYLDRVISGDWIAAFAMTEPEAGSDAGAMQLTASLKSNGYMLNGKKTLISNAGLADFYTVFARTAEGSRGITAFIVEASDAGLRIHPQDLMAVHPIGAMEFDNCILPADRRLGNEGDGLKIAYSTLDVFRSSVAAAGVGMAERAFQEAVNFARNRKQFGKPLSEFQAIQ